MMNIIMAGFDLAYFSKELAKMVFLLFLKFFYGKKYAKI